ncbi:MAG: cystathionine beta-lyase [Labrys sp. (in: a-proteobacteria)]
MKKASLDDLSAYGDNTRLVNAGRDPARFDGFVNTPVFHGSTILSPSVKDYLGETGRYTYARRGSPGSEALCEALQTMERSAGVVLCPSGLSAATTALLSILNAGDHLLMTDSAYGPTRSICKRELPRFGIEVTYYDPLIGGDIEQLMKPNTKAVYCESPGSLTFEMQDVPAIAAAAHRREAFVLMDNTWATPLYCKAHALGVDLSIQAGTKYIVGHSDVMMGTVSASERAWPHLKRFTFDTGLCVGPDDMFLSMRGLRTMGVRLARHQKSALEIASWLETHDQVSRVLYPALPSHPGHAIFKRDYSGASGLFSVILQPGSMEAVGAFLDDLALFGIGASWGGYESLAIPFDSRNGRTATVWAPEGPTVRLHIGLEEVPDLMADLAAGLERYRRAR